MLDKAAFNVVKSFSALPVEVKMAASVAVSILFVLLLVVIVRTERARAEAEGRLQAPAPSKLKVRSHVRALGRPRAAYAHNTLIPRRVAPAPLRWQKSN